MRKMNCAGCEKPVPENHIQSQIDIKRVFCNKECVLMYYDKLMKDRCKEVKNVND